MISTRIQIARLEEGQIIAWRQGDLESHTRITSQLNELYKEQEAAMKDKVQRCAELRKGLVAYRVFVTEMN